MPRLWNSLLPTSTPSTPATATMHATGGVSSGYTSLGGTDIDRQVSAYYERVIWVFRCVDAIATKVASLPIVFRQGARDDSAKEVQDIPLNRVLNIKANEYESAFAARYRFSSNLLLSDRGLFIEVVKSASGAVSQMHVLPAGRVQPIPDPTNYVAGYRVMGGVNGVDFLKPEQVLWIKAKPHPTDPYRQMTPMTAAGISADTDFLARMFNRNFLRNDGRPGMLITVEDLNPNDAEELKRRFSGGGSNAGKTSVVEGRGLDIADMSASPRDAMWTEVLEMSMKDILLAFGCPESVMGNASERTFDNADAEDVGFWNNTLIPHSNVLAQGYDSLTLGGLDDNIYVVHSTKDIDALQQVSRNHELDLRQQFQAGLITIDMYLKGTGREPFDVPGTRVLWLGANLMPIGSEKDQKALAPEVAAEQQQLPPGQIPQQGQTGVQQQIGTARRQIAAAPDSASRQELSRRLAQLEDFNRADTSRQRPNVGRIPKRPLAHKELPPVRATSSSRELALELKVTTIDAAPEGTVPVTPIVHGLDRQVQKAIAEHPYSALRIKYEALFDGIVYNWSVRQLEAVSGRLRGTKARKGTRHWDGPDLITKELDPKYVVNSQKWVDDLKASLLPVVTDLVQQTITDTMQQFQSYGYDHSTDGVGLVTDQIAEVIARSALSRTLHVEEVLDELERRRATIEEMQAQVEKLANRRRGWSKGLAVELTTAAVEGGKSFVTTQIKGLRKTWHTMGDDNVRATHRHLDGRTIFARNKFRTGAYSIRYPGDPLAPPEMVINCRCFLTFHYEG